MLTNTDLQAIGKIVDQRLDKKLDIKLKPIKFKLNKLDIKLNKIDNKLDATINLFDNDVNNLYKRMDRVENKLNLPPFVAT